MPAPSVIACCIKILEKGLKISFAESASTGRLIYDFTSVPNCGNIIKGSIVCYDRSVKEELFKIPAEVIDEHSAESAEVTQLLAENLRDLLPADIVVAVTGLASPGGSETPEKPVGTMFVHGIIKDKPWSRRFFFEGSPDDIVAQTINATALTLLDELKDVE
ncbi:nicotinamide-nucleotide amidase [Arcticibacter tournemirensis]|uniref:CinA family protein n=1 Tax=Arcticibacter tournemirensis TaxID=699437 RepID=A0A5M9HA88_9SPHI|nr:CinA family protein [Arcticibacter tournemirensis]KAA8483560.1 CinA family protein [Arcticibacter tournemirensis]TQM51491.1 nicotinamide-nucleotide amidase [Arcticibacter tournemirensis]